MGPFHIVFRAGTEERTESYELGNYGDTRYNVLEVDPPMAADGMRWDSQISSLPKFY